MGDSIYEQWGNVVSTRRLGNNACFTATQERLIFEKLLHFRYVLPRERIHALRKHTTPFSVRLEIEHDVREVPKELIFIVGIGFWSGRFARMQKALEGLGYDFDV